MKYPLLYLICLFFMLSCQFNKSVNKDLITGLYTTGDGLGAERVYLSTETEEIERTTFTYGEKIFVMFDDMSGFVKANDKVFPGMHLVVTGQAGDTVMQVADLYADNPEGFDITPLVLRTDLIVAAPIHSGKAYTWHIDIWDKKGKGKFSSTLDFNVIPNALIKVESNVSYDEIYLFTRERGRVLTDNMATSGEDTYILFEGLTGFNVENNFVFPGLSLRVTDQTGKALLEDMDLFEELSASGVLQSDFNQLISAQLSFPTASAETQVNCEALLWDKRGNGKVRVTTKLTLK